MTVLFRFATAFALTLGAGCTFAAEFVVNSFGEEGDFFPGDGVAEVEPGSAITTLHAAIEEANAFPGPDTIRFALRLNYICKPQGEVFDTTMIRYRRPLPPLNDHTGGTTIVGPGRSLMFVGGLMDYSQPETEARAAFVLHSAENTIGGFSLYDYDYHMFVIEGELANDNVIENVLMATGCEAMDQIGSGEDSVLIQGGASRNRIVGCDVTTSGTNGVRITGVGTDDNVVVGNYLGLEGIGSPSVCGIHVDEIDAPFEIDLTNGDICEEVKEFTNAVADFRARTHLPNAGFDVLVDGGASNNVIGGVGPENANFFAGPAWDREYVLSEPGVTNLLKQQTEENPERLGSAIVLDGSGTRGNRIVGNYIGYRDIVAVRRSGNRGIVYPKRSRAGKESSAIVIRNGASDNVVGSSDPLGRNRIAYSLEDAIVIEGMGTTGNQLFNNYIHSEKNGISIQAGASNNLIGVVGEVPNLVRSAHFGIDISGSESTGNEIKNNIIDGNGFSGVAIYEGARFTKVGGSGSGEGNTIINNSSDGVVIYDPDTDFNEVIGNLIADNHEIGVFLAGGASHNIIGGTVSGSGNEIMSNGVTGVEIHDEITTANRVLGNRIHGNGTRGIFMVDGTSGNVVGGEPLAERNLVYENSLSGIEINGALTSSNSIRLNSIYDNREKGILLSFGANEGILPPVIETFIPVAGTAPANSFVDIYADDAEEGEVHIGSTTTDEDGNYSVSLDLTPFLQRKITTTATDSGGNTSEFSAPLDIIPPAFLSESADFVLVEGDDGSVPMTLEGSPEILLQWYYRGATGDYAALTETAVTTDTTSSTLSLHGVTPGQEGYYQCRADNGLGEVRSREVYVRVVSAGIREVSVNTLSDVSDGTTSSIARLLTEPGADGVISLREAIEAANTMEGSNSIAFSFSGVISPTAALPAIDDASGSLVLDGGGMVRLDGSTLSGSESGLVITSGENTIRGMTIYGFPAHGVEFSGADATENVIADCLVGTDGTTVFPNGSHGIMVHDGAHHNLIGGTTAGDSNLIAGNGHSGVVLSGAGTTNNRVEGNHIGRISGDSPTSGNTLAGIRLEEGASNNLIGGEETGAGNSIVGNTGIGVWVVGTTTAGNSIIHNAIYDNGDLGVRLFDGGNGAIVQPVVTSIDPIRGTAPAGSVVDCYIDLAEEGETFLVRLQSDETGAFTTSLDLTEFDGHYLTVLATDTVGNTSAFSRGVAIDYSAPTLTLNGSSALTVACGTTYTDAGVRAEDNIDGNITTSVVTTIVDSSDTTLATLTGVGPGTYRIHYDVTDSAGYAATRVTRTVTVVDATAPVVTLNGGATLSLSCGQPYEEAGATALDSCEGEVEVVIGGTVNASVPGVYTLQYSATDSAGNTSTPLERTVTVADTLAPVISRVGDEAITVSCGVAYMDPGVTALDDCEGDVAVQVGGMVDVTRAGTYLLSYEASDSSGNRAQPMNRQVTVVDTTAPVLRLNGEADVVLSCGEAYVERGATLTDTCDPGAAVVMTGSLRTDTVGVYTLAYDATDSAGNVAETVYRTVTVLGDGAPQILLNGDEAVTLTCETEYRDLGARAVDACLGDITASLVVDNPVRSGVPGSYLVTYTVTDGGGTAATPVTRSVTIQSCSRPCDTLCVGEADDLVDVDGDGLSKCKEICVGTSDSNPDTDGDGMSDGYEYTHQLNPLMADGDLDPDLDGVVNLDEFLENGSPRNPATPVTSYFVHPAGSDVASGGSRTEPWQGLGYALSRVNASAGHPVHIYLSEGHYDEAVTLKSYVTVSPLYDGVVSLTGPVILPAHSHLKGVDVLGTGSDTALVFLTGGAAKVSYCMLDGSLGSNLTGIVVEAGSTPASQITGCLFMNLAVGLDVSGALPHLRRSRFMTIGNTAVLVREGAPLGSDSDSMGAGLNGWNDFRDVTPGQAVRHEGSASLSAQWNEWGTTVPAEVAALTEGNVDSDHALEAGGAEDGAAVEVIVSTAGVLTRLAGATVTLTQGTLTLNATTDSDGRLTYPALAAGSYTVTATASQHRNRSMTVELDGGLMNVVHLALSPNSTPDPDPDPDPEPEKQPVSCSGGEGNGHNPLPGDFALIGLLLAVFMVRAMGQRDANKNEGHMAER